MTNPTVVATDNISQMLKPGPVAIIRNEDGVSISSTVKHAKSLGFANVIVAATAQTDDEDVINLKAPAETETFELVNLLMDGLAGRWIYLGYNAEYLFFPFCEGRSISDVAQFIEEERREAVFSVTVDLYPSGFDRNSPDLPPEDAHFDVEGYFSRDRYDGPEKLDRQIEVFGGLKRRYSEHIEWTRQRIDRIAFFKAKPGLRLDENGLMNDPEMNTIACPWHHSMTFCVASFRVAKSLINNPGSAYEVESFMWDGSTVFDWTSQTLMKRGLMEPGQWF